MRAALIAKCYPANQDWSRNISPHTNYPALLAMEAASHNELAPGRVILGIGTVLNALRKHSFDSVGTTQVVKESIEVIKRVCSGKLVDYDGGFRVGLGAIRIFNLEATGVYAGAFGICRGSNP